MVMSKPERYDFIGLSTDTKPTPETSERVVNGSTYYCADTSKLYVWCDSQWYEKTAPGGGTEYQDFVGTDGTNPGAHGLVPAPATTDAGKFLKADGTWGSAGGGASYTAGDGIDITNDVIKATNTGKARVLTTDDYNWPTTGTATSVALWLLEDGYYTCKESNIAVLPNTSISSISPGAFLIEGTMGTKMVFYLTPDGTTRRLYSTRISDGALLAFYNLLGTDNVVNNLTSTSGTVPLSAKQGKVLKDLIDSLAVRASGAPTTSTAGQVGTLYEDTTNGDLYICTDATNPYVWEEVGAGGGPTVVQTTGTSTTDVMSQNAVTSMVYADPASRRKIKIGASASVGVGNDDVISIGNGSLAGANYAMAIGYNAQARGLGAIMLGWTNGSSGATGYASMCLGKQTAASGTGSVALGASAQATAQGEIAIGASDTFYGYNSSNYRLLTGLYDGQSDHDAATVGQLKMGVLSTTPTGTTVGFPGRLYTLDTGGGSYEVYLCVHDNGDNTYVWKQLSLI